MAMASSACSSLSTGPNALFSLFSPRRRPAARISTMAASPRQSPIPIRWSFGGGDGSAVARRDLRATAAGRRYKGTVMREQRLAEMIEQKVVEAKEVCKGDERSDECKVAWDEVEEVSRAKANLRRRLAEGDRDPLEGFCQDNPDTDECGVVYDH